MATSDMQMSLGQEDDKLVMNWLRTTGVEMEVIAESTGLNVSSLQKIRRGQTKKPHPSTIQKLRQCMTSDRMQRTSPPSLSLEAGGGEYFTAPEIRGTTVQNHLSPPDTISPESLRHPRYDPPEHHVPNQEIFIPVHGFVWLTESELKVVDHPAFQRLRRVRQLGMAHMVYPGATHTRYEHVLGVLHITSEVIKAIQGNHERAKSKDKLKDPSDSSHWGLPLGARESAFCRLAALLHDIGHLPFGHSIEDELSILNHHDKEDRLALILLNWKASELNSQFLGQVIDELYTFDTPIQLESINRSITPTELVISIILHEPPRSVTANYRTLLEERRREDDDSWPKKEDVVRAFAADLAKVDVRLEVCADIVGNTICADLLDYLHRDWHHVGKSKFLDDRVLHYMEIR
ncbi:MAG TPA: HD domain-containing protein, partial [Fimbriimonadaceae bacterium]|nr:HD domain-containing protein [Fimbriimonadaceae bacterium]